MAQHEAQVRITVDAETLAKALADSDVVDYAIDLPVFLERSRDGIYFLDAQAEAFDPIYELTLVVNVGSG